MIAKPLKGSAQEFQNDSGVEKSSRGYGSASPLEALKFGQAQLKVPAACASQRAIDRLRSGQLPEHSTLFGVLTQAVPAPSNTMRARNFKALPHATKMAWQSAYFKCFSQPDKIASFPRERSRPVDDGPEPANAALRDRLRDTLAAVLPM